MPLPESRTPVSLWRYPSVLAVAVLGTLMALGGERWQRHHVQERFQEQLKFRAIDNTARLQRDIASSLEVMDSLRSLFAASESVTRSEFKAFTQGTLAAHPEFQALEWLPRIPGSTRAEIEATLAQTVPGLGIRERDAQGRLVPASLRDEYYPVLYAEPLDRNLQALGFDAASRAEARQIMAQARDSGQIASTGSVTLVQGDGKVRAVILYVPIYANGLPNEDVAARRANLRGFGVGVLHYERLVEQALGNISPMGLDMLLLDASTKGETNLLHFVPSSRQSTPQPKLAEARAGPHHEVALQMPGREWRLLFRPASRFYAEFASAWNWWILATGLAMTGLVGLHLWRRIRHGEAMQALVGKLNDAQRLAQTGSWELDLRSNRLTWSDQIDRIFEMDSDQVAGTYQEFLAAVHPDDRQRVDASHRRAVREHAPYQISYRLLLRDGRQKYLHSHCDVQYDPDGQPWRAYGTIQDITASRQTEEQLRLAEKVFANTQEGILVTDLTGKIVTVNPAFTEITGYSREEVLGQNPRLWKSDRHDQAFYAALWQGLQTSGAWQGEIWNRRKNGESYPVWQNINVIHDAEGRPANYVAMFTDISSLKHSQAQLTYLAQHDPLTGLPNRSLLQDRLNHAMSRAQRSGQQLAVLFLDLDHFKRINDSQGHPAGDRLLQDVAARLLATARKEDTVARMGGDEFIILMEHLQAERNAAGLAEKLLHALSRPFQLDEREFFISGSIGISLYPRDGASAEALISNADVAMYRAKAEGRNAYQYYTQSLTDAVLERVALEADLRRALAAEELYLHYQPQYDLSDGRMIGAEALVRWRHRERGYIGPDRFIPVAEESGLIHELGVWVLRAACRQARQWLDAGAPLRAIAVNVSGAQIQRADFLVTVREALAASALPPEKLELEVTESFFMGQEESAIETLRALNSIGVTLSIDDFGTGYSSLAYLKRMPIHKLKVDRSFVRDLPGDEDDGAIVKAVIALASSMGLMTLAEGVETAEQREFLVQLGCEHAQGYYFSKPLDPVDFSWN